MQKGGIASKRGYAEEVGNYGTCMVQYIPVHVPVRTGTKTHGTGTILSILFSFIIFLYLRSPKVIFRNIYSMFNDNCIILNKKLDSLTNFH